MARTLVNLGCGDTTAPGWLNLDHGDFGPAVIRWRAGQRIPLADRSASLVYSSHFLEHLPRDLARRVLGECFRVLEGGGVLRLVVPDLEYNARLYLAALERLRSPGSGPTEVDQYDWAVINLLDQLVRSRPGGEMAPYLRRSTVLPWVIATTGGAEVEDEGRRPRRPRRWPSPRRLLKALAFRARALRPAVAVQRSGELHRWIYDAHSLSRAVTVAGFVEPTVLAADRSRVPRFSEYHLDTTSDGRIRKPNSLFLEALKPEGSR